VQSIGLLRSLVIFWGFLDEFLGYLEWLEPNRKYFLGTEGPTVIFPNVQGPRQNLQEAQGPKCKMVSYYGFLNFIFQWKIWWTGSVVRGSSDAARVHHGPRWRGQEGTAAPWWSAGARAHRCSPAAVEEDELNEAVPEGCSPEHERWRRGSVTEAKNGSSLSSA
jgi:hypothetical protein